MLVPINELGLLKGRAPKSAAATCGRNYQVRACPSHADGLPGRWRISSAQHRNGHWTAPPRLDRLSFESAESTPGEAFECAFGAVRLMPITGRAILFGWALAPKPSRTRRVCAGVLSRLFAYVVRAHRARRDVDRRRALVHERGPSPVAINEPSGGFADKLAQRIARAEPRFFTNLNHGRRSLWARSSLGTPYTARRELRAIVFQQRPMHCRSVRGRSNGSQFRRLAGPASYIGQCRGCARSLSCPLSRRAPYRPLVWRGQTFVRSRHTSQELAPLGVLTEAFGGPPPGTCYRCPHPEAKTLVRSRPKFSPVAEPIERRSSSIYRMGTIIMAPKLRDLSRLPPEYDELVALSDTFLKPQHPIPTAILGAVMVEHELDQLLRSKIKRNDGETWGMLTGDHGPVKLISLQDRYGLRLRHLR
jgi:hypothetical protein